MNQHLKTSLEELADAEYADAPPTTVDIGRARADGRRRIATARLAPIGGGLALVAACALVANGLGGTSPAERPATMSAGSGDLTAGTDPLSEVASFGYVPDGYQVATHVLGSGLTTVILQTKPMLPSQKPGDLIPAELQLSSSATELKPVPPETTTEVKVKGSPKAYIVHDGDGTEIADRLQWQTASGSWFTLVAFNKIHGAQLQAMLVKVADSVTANGSAVPLPIHIDGVPKGATLGAASLADPIVVGQNPPAARTTLDFGDGKSRFISFSIVVMPVGSTDPQGGKSGPPASTDACKDSKGLRICVLDSHDGASGVDPLESVGGAKGLLDQITSLGTDRSNWTTHVLN
ncbi:hypothetical protein ABH935_003969 [Catenulispora sp. GAS73]|uniref:hypothetical protein n=1 Tax=Catenulispora sp. GAS73 TaxID=3156269 RepID=UPI003513ACF2